MNIQFFGELEIGAKFKYAIFFKGSIKKITFEKTGKNAGVFANKTYHFNYNECVEIA
jgi:hypothetical protein